MLLRDFADFGDGLHDADFVVRIHDGDQDRLGSDRAAKIVQIDSAISVHREVSDLAAKFFEVLAGIEGGFVLRYLRDDVIALVAVLLGRAFDGEIGGFRRAASEDNFFWAGIDESSDLRAAVLDRFFSLPAEFMAAAGGIAEFVGEIGKHGLKDARVNGRRGLVVQVNGELECHADSF